MHQLVIGIAHELGMVEFEELFPLHLHDILEHNLWYFKNDGFCFIDKNGNGVSFAQKDFVDLINEFESNFNEMMDEWSRRNSKHEF